MAIKITYHRGDNCDSDILTYDPVEYKYNCFLHVCKDSHILG